MAVACTGCKNILFQTPSLLFYLDYEKVLELEPDNFEATNELRKINQVLTSKENSGPKKAAAAESKPAAGEKKTNGRSAWQAEGHCGERPGQRSFQREEIRASN